jgi:DNA replication protein DnaC
MADQPDELVAPAPKWPDDLEPPDRLDLAAMTTEQIADLVRQKREAVEAAEARHAVGRLDLRNAVEELARKQAEQRARPPVVREPSPRDLADTREAMEAIAANRLDLWDKATPPEFVGATLGDLDAAQSPDVLRGWLAKPDDKKRALVLVGSTGVGKSRMAYAVAREFVPRGVVLFRSLPALLDELRPSGRNDAFHQAKTCDLLVVDDIGAERDTDWSTERFYLVVDHRWQWRLPTIITSNLAPRDLIAHLGDRVASRLLSNATIVEVGGTDRRRL